MGCLGVPNFLGIFNPSKAEFGGLALSSNVYCCPFFKDCYILDQGGIRIFVWKGKNANKEEKQQAMSRALVGAGLGAFYGTA